MSARRLSLPAASLVVALALGGSACSGSAGPAGLEGAPGKNALVNLVPEPAGAHCANGGIAVQTGLDANGNGQLDASEVDASKTQYACNGSTGSTTSPTLNRVTAENAGTHCAEGGIRIESGVDANLNGVLDDTEVNPALTQYVCQAALGARIYFGDLTVASTADLAQLDGIEIVVGNVTFVGSFGGSLSVPQLQVVTGDLEIDDAAPTAALAPSGTPAFDISFPQLRQVSNLYVYSEYASSFSAPALMQVGTIDLEVTDLAALDLLALKAVGQFELYGSQLTALSLPAVTEASLYMEGTPSLQSISAPSLTAAFLELYDAPVLTTLDFPVLASIASGSSAYGTDALSICSVEALNAAAFSRGSSGAISYPGDDTACDPTQLCLYVTVGSSDQTYRQCFQRESFGAAQSTCQSLGGNLLVLDDANEFSAISPLFQSGRFLQNSWIGYSDAAVEGTWSWVSEVTGYVPASGEFWNEGEPNNSGGNENCAVLFSNGLANDADCGTQNTFVCEMAATP
jgi:hypothetical protein